MKDKRDEEGREEWRMDRPQQKNRINEEIN